MGRGLHKIIKLREILEIKLYCSSIKPLNPFENPSQNLKATLPKKDQFNNTVETEIGLWLIEKSPKLVKKNTFRNVSNIDNN